MYALLIAEDLDDVAIFSMVLQRAGLAVSTAKELEPAMQNWVERPADIILVALPDQLPRTVVQRVRQEALVPLILVLKGPDESLQIDLLKRGADLVVVPPFSAKLLIAQIEVLLRRAGNVPDYRILNDPGAGATLTSAVCRDLA